MKYADYERRLISFIIDLAISLVFSIIFLTLLTVMIAPLKKIVLDIFVPFTCLILFIYLLISYRVFKGQTIGGNICNVRIVNRDGTDLRLKTAFVRSLLLSVLILSIYNIFYMFLLRTQISFFDESTDTRAIQKNPINDDINSNFIN